VGFNNLPSQIHRSFINKGFNFTLMVVGMFLARRIRARSYSFLKMGFVDWMSISFSGADFEWLFDSVFEGAHVL
jgi:hypothetical protein